MEVKIGQQAAALYGAPAAVNSDGKVHRAQSLQTKAVKSVYGLPKSIVKIKPYAYVTTFNEIDYDYATDYFINHSDNVMGRCSSVRNGNIVGRQLDWIYSDQCSFYVYTPRYKDRYASIGVSGSIRKLTESFVMSDSTTPAYKLIPFQLQDGVNEKGLYCNMNVVPSTSAKLSYDAKIENRVELSTLMVARFVLDYFEDAKTAAEYLRDYCKIYFPKSLKSVDYECHYMICDASGATYIVEHNADECVVIDATNRPYMTNFAVYGLNPNADGKVYTPADSPVHKASENGISEHGSGLERWNVIVDNYATCGNEEGMRALLDKLTYTRTYATADDPADPFWFTEYVGGGNTVDSPPSHFAEVVAKYGQAFLDRKRDGSGLITWQTVHSSIYNLEKKTLDVIFEEDGEQIHFSLAASADEGEAIWESGSGINSAVLKNSESRASGEHSVSYGYRCLSHGNCSSTRGVATDTLSPTGSGAIPEWRDGYAADASGHLTIAGGRASHTEGDNTVTNNPSEHAEGRYNISHYATNVWGNSGNTQHSIGIGKNGNERKNAFEIMQNGDAYLMGVGGYDGTNYSEAAHIAEVLDGKVNKDNPTASGTLNIGEDNEIISENGIALGNDLTSGLEITTPEIKIHGYLLRKYTSDDLTKHRLRFSDNIDLWQGKDHTYFTIIFIDEDTRIQTYSNLEYDNTTGSSYVRVKSYNGFDYENYDPELQKAYVISDSYPDIGIEYLLQEGTITINKQSLAYGDKTTSIGQNSVSFGVSDHKFNEVTKKTDDSPYSSVELKELIDAADDETTGKQYRKTDESRTILKEFIDTWNSHVSDDPTKATDRRFALSGNVGSISVGKNNVALGEGSVAAGRGTLSLGKGSVSSGNETLAFGHYALAHGMNARAYNYGSISLGRSVISDGYCSIAIGADANNNYKPYLSAEETINAHGDYSISIGNGNAANGKNAVALGEGNEARSNNSIIIGKSNKVTDIGAIAIGEGLYPAYSGQIVLGKYNYRDTKAAFCIGWGVSNDSQKNIYTVSPDGNGRYAGTVEASAIILRSSTPGSNKRFKLTVSDSGVLETQELTADTVSEEADQQETI